MPRYRVVERRSYKATYLIDADSEEAAGRLDGVISEEEESDHGGDELLSVEEVGDDE